MKQEPSVRINYMLIIAALGLCTAACQRHDLDKHAVISALLAKESAQWSDPRRRPCVMADVRKSPYVGDEQSTFSIAGSDTSKFFRICGADAGPHYQIYDPEIAGDRALIMLDFHCGDMCGSGSSVYLDKKEGEWKVAEEQRRWIS